MAVAAAVLAPLVAVRRRRHDQPSLWSTVRSMDAADRWRPAAIGIVGTFAFTAFMLVGMREAPGVVDPMSLTLIAALIAIVAFSLLAIWDMIGFDWSAPSASEWWGVLWWGAGTMALGAVLWFMGNRDVSGTTASVFMGVMPVSALVLSYLLLGEPFEWIHLVGMATGARRSDDHHPPPRRHGRRRRH